MLPLESLPQERFLKGWTKYERFSHLSLVMKGWEKNSISTSCNIWRSRSKFYIISSQTTRCWAATCLCTLLECESSEVCNRTFGKIWSNLLFFVVFKWTKNFLYFTANCCWDTNKDASCHSDLNLEACFHDHNLALNLMEQNFFWRQHLPQSTKPVISSGMSWALLSCRFPLSYSKFCFLLFEFISFPHRHPKFMSSLPSDFRLWAHVFGLETLISPWWSLNQCFIQLFMKAPRKLQHFKAQIKCIFLKKRIISQPWHQQTTCWRTTHTAHNGVWPAAKWQNWP